MKIAFKKGFTLIELLVVITIIGILATGAVTTFTAQIQKARDSTRIGDIKALQAAVEQAYQDSSRYPDAQLNSFSGAIIDYIATMPEDSKNGEWCKWDQVCSYLYNVWPDGWVSNGVYELSVAFENSSNLANQANDTTDNGNNPNRYEISNKPSAAPDTNWEMWEATPNDWLNIVK